MIDITGVFPFSFLEDKYDISVDSVLRCDPSLANQIACLILAGLAMELFMKALAKLVCAILNRSSEAVTDKLLLEQIDNLKNEEFAVFSIKRFEDWCKKNPRKANCIKDDPTIEDFMKRVNDGDFKSRDEAIVAYMKSTKRRNVWKEFAVAKTGDGLARSMQHVVAGLFGLYAVTMTNDQDSFLMFARWGILCEAGYELFDTIENILYPIITNEFDFRNLMLAFHHVALYLTYPVNQRLLPSKIGRDVAMATFLYAGLPAMMAPVQFLKNYADFDLTETKGKIMYIAIALNTVFTVMIPRSVHWCYFAHKVLRFAWDEGVSWPVFALFVLAVVLFSAFNVMVCFFTYKGLRNAIKKLRKSTEELEEEKKKGAALLQYRLSERSSLINEMAKEANMSSRRLCPKRSISLMGVDYELDDDEVEEIEKRRSMRSSSVASRFDTIKEE